MLSVLLVVGLFETGWKCVFHLNAVTDGVVLVNAKTGYALEI